VTKEGTVQQKRVGILVYPEVEVLDFAGPFEVFSVTRLDEERRREQPSPFEVVLVAERTAPVRASGGLRVLPEYDLVGCPPLDVLVVPGGWGSRREVDNAALIGWIRERAARAEVTASVCTGAFLLARAGLLNGRPATTHWRSLDRLRDTFPAVTVERHRHVVQDGALFTSAGIAAGIDLALQVVARYHGEAVARATARHMEYPYPEDNARRV
jgi:transcriptional regulator GlxA family with amidase domain